MLEFFEVLSAMRRGSLFVFVLQCANRLFSCGVRVSRQIVCFGRSQTSSLARLCCLRGMFVGAAIFAGSICALSRNARVGAGFDRVSVSLHMLWRCYESKSAFVLCARMSIVCCRVCRVHLVCSLCVFACRSSHGLFLGCACVRR